ncbi:MAG TPA: hypothetical protein RMG45_16090, partial [Polyangiaceae bacterium LLY-WYZ-15_(1-7)]|nr:hypothetical protein [Polyangiaceae bacterium LLY-WYZ-15_(1-7)]
MGGHRSGRVRRGEGAGGAGPRRRAQGLARGRGGRDARPPVLDPKQKKQTVRRTWAGILVAVAVA